MLVLFGFGLSLSSVVLSSLTFIEKRNSLGNDGSFFIGLTGPTGLQGPAGDIGFSGLQGEIGTTGVSGPVGENGSVGIPGIAGNMGPVGPKGFLGSTGKTGQQGLSGDPGITGPVGQQGITGEVGNNGPTGFIGITGDTGSVGIVGETGTQGIDGDSGPVISLSLSGATGLQGQQGNTGYDGMTGPDGHTGLNGYPSVETGSNGPTGQTGPNGQNGPTGPTGVGSSFPASDNLFSLNDDQSNFFSISITGGNGNFILEPNTTVSGTIVTFPSTSSVEDVVYQGSTQTLYRKTLLESRFFCPRSSGGTATLTAVTGITSGLSFQATNPKTDSSAAVAYNSSGAFHMVNINFFSPYTPNKFPLVGYAPGNFSSAAMNYRVNQVSSTGCTIQGIQTSGATGSVAAFGFCCMFM